MAIAVGPDRTTIWTSLRLTAPAGTIGVVIPAPPGASLDRSSDAWLEALEVATAPRVFPPESVSPFCPGESGRKNPMDVVGWTSHVESAPLDEVLVLADADAVGAWAGQHGLVISPALAAQLAALAGQRFVAARVTAAGGEALTPTLRVVMPGTPAALPLALTQAGADALLVTTWVLGEGRAKIEGATPVSIASDALVWSAHDGTSSWEAARHDALAPEGGHGALAEAAGHEALSHNTAVASGAAAIDGVVTTYFERAGLYAALGAEPAECIAYAAAALAASSPVAPSCPRADLGVVDGEATCTETTVSGQTNPETLRCGSLADDLAVALSGMAPSAAWLTRHSLLVPAGEAGASFAISLGDGAAILPVTSASSVDLAECEGDAGTGKPDGGRRGGGPDGGALFDDDPGTTSGGKPGGGGVVGIGDDFVYVDSGCSCSGTVESDGTYVGGDDDGDGSGDDDGSVNEVAEDEYASDDDCGGDTTESSSSGDDCEGDTGESTASSGDDCSGESADGSSSGDDCGGDGSSGGDDCSGDGSSGGDDCSGDGSSGGDDCSGGDGGDCSVQQKNARRPRGPRLSAVTMALLFVVAPLRRWRRRSRRGRRLAREGRRTADPGALARRRPPRTNRAVSRPLPSLVLVAMAGCNALTGLGGYDYDRVPDAGCPAGFADCDGNADNGCEAEVDTDPNRCGPSCEPCGFGADSYPLCAAGQCSIGCNGRFGDCDGEPANGCETSFDDDPDHCGACDAGCEGGTCDDARCAPVAVASVPGLRRLAASGDLLAFIGYNSVGRLDPATYEPQTLARIAGLSSELTGATPLATDGALVFFATTESGGSDCTEGQVMAIDGAGGPVTELAKLGMCVDELAADGERLYAAGLQPAPMDGGYGTALYEVPYPAGMTRLIEAAAEYYDSPAIALDDTSVFWLSEGQLKRADKEEPTVEALVEAARPLAIDEARLYFRQNASLVTLPTAGGATSTFAASQPDWIATDASFVYWSGNRTLSRAQKDGSDVKVLLTATPMSHLTAYAGRLFFANGDTIFKLVLPPP